MLDSATRSLGFLALVLLAAGCTQVEVPVWVVRAEPAFDADQGERVVAETIAELGWHVDRVDEASGRVATRWQQRAGLLGTARARVELRLQPEPFAVAVSVPREVHDGRRWVVRGEDEARRAELVAALTARLSPPAATPRPHP